MKRLRLFFSDPINRRAVLIAAGLLLSAVSCAVFLLYGARRPSGELLARIYLRGELLTTIDLNAVTEPRLLTVELPEGGSNTIRVVPGEIAVIEADCPDRLCVQTGYTSSPLCPVICLPHGLLIQIETDTSEKDRPDIISY